MSPGGRVLLPRAPGFGTYCLGAASRAGAVGGRGPGPRGMRQDLGVGAEPTLVLVTGPPGTGKSTLAEAAAGRLRAPVLAWDWVMAGLTPFDEIQRSLRAVGPAGVRQVGWSMLWNLALAQLRRGRSAVLDGCARTPEIDRTRQLAAEEGGVSRVVVTRCRDTAVHRARVESRRRDIPGWYELDWDHVAGFLSRWDEPAGADLYLDATDPLADNLARLDDLLPTWARTPPSPRRSVSP
jgi:predicted kinase